MTILVIDEPNEDTKSESKSSLKFFDKFDFIVTSQTPSFSQTLSVLYLVCFTDDFKFGVPLVCGVCSVYHRLLIRQFFMGNLLEDGRIGT